MQNENQFEVIPSLDDTEGLQNYLNQENLNNMGLTGQQPQMLQPEDIKNSTPSVEPQPQQQGYTQEQIAQIIAENEAYRTRLQQQQQFAQAQPQQKPVYSPQQAELIKRAIDRGIPLERIIQALGQNSAQNQVLQKLNSLEARLAQRDYEEAQNAFVTKMQDFGTKFGLSESDLVTFANTALSKGINLINTPDVESIFRAIYPDQYAIRMQRINSTPSTIYGGGSIGQTPQEGNRQIDAYVENFLKQRMPNQYNNNFRR